MKIILIIGVVIECIFLILLTVFKKWTKKTFIAIALITAICCSGIGIFEYQSQVASGEVNQRASLYMAAKLIQEEYTKESLEVLSVVSDEKCSGYNGRAVRALAYNLNEAYETTLGYLQDIATSEEEQKIVEASSKKIPVEKEVQQAITSQTLALIDASDMEARQWDTEMKVRFMGFKLSDEEKTELVNEMALVKAMIQENRYEDAYNLLASDNRNHDVKNSIIVSNMYVNNYNRRIMADTDTEYARLWDEAVEQQTNLNKVSLTVPTGDTVSKEYQEYQKAKARYNLAVSALNQEAVKRAINYLKSIEDPGSEVEIGYQLQLARLYFMSNQIDLAKEYIDKIFTSDTLDDEQWLGQDAAAFKEAFIIFISEPTNTEYSVLFDNLMAGLYQSLFDDDDFESFKEFVKAHLREVFGGIFIKKVDTTDFPQVIAEVSATQEGVVLSEENLIITDTRESIKDFLVEMIEVNNLNLSLALDCSGSMQGERLSESKAAIRNCISQMSDDTFLSFVTFDNTANLKIGLTDSRYLVMNLVEGVNASGGTNIASGLLTAVNSLKGTNGTKVIILLSDGVDGDESKKLIGSVLAEALANDIVIYTIGLQGCDESYLQSISNQTGGQFIMVNNTAQLNRTYQEIQNALMNNYIISYSVEGKNEDRSLVAETKDSFVEARKKYSSNVNSEYQYNDSEDIQEAGYYKQIGGTGRGR